MTMVGEGIKRSREGFGNEPPMAVAMAFGIVG